MIEISRENESQTDDEIAAKVKKRKIRNGIIIALIFILLAGGGAAIYKFFSAKSIVFVGCTHYTDEELEQYIFNSKTPNTLIYKLWGNKNKEIPFIQKYDVEFTWPDKMYVTVYEKAIVGYVDYMGCKMYFDRDGTVVESSTEEFQNVPEIEGLKFDSIVLGSKLEIGDDEVFTQILDLTQSFDKYDLDVDKVYFDSDFNVILYIGTVKVNLGKTTDYSDRLFELKQVSGKFGSLKGTLYLNEYDGTEKSVVFKREN